MVKNCIRHNLPLRVALYLGEPLDILHLPRLEHQVVLCKGAAGRGQQDQGDLRFLLPLLHLQRHGLPPGSNRRN